MANYAKTWRTSPVGKRIYALLSTGYTGTTPEIAKSVNCAHSTALSLITAMHADGETHIERWNRGANGPFIPVHASGPGKDADRPRPCGSKAKNKQYMSTLRDRLGGGEEGRRRARHVISAMNGSVPVSTIVFEGMVAWRKGQGVLIDLRESSA